MTQALPRPIAAYVEANARLDVDAMLKPFAADAVLLDNGKIAPSPNGDNPAVMLWLQEQDPSYDEYFPAATISSVQRRSDPSDSCHCQWMFK